MILFLLLSAVVAILFVIIYFKFQKEASHSAVNSPSFNLPHYILCCKITALVYSIHEESLSTPILTEMPEMEHIEYLISADYGWNDMYKTQTITGILGKVKCQNLGIISFRGTSNWQEILSDMASQFQVPLNYVSEFSMMNSEDVIGIPLSSEILAAQKSKSGEYIGEGWYNLYCRALELTTENNCVCDSPCSELKCKVLKNGTFSMIKKKCPTSDTDVCNPNDPIISLASQVLNGVRRMKTLGIEKILITGHSLGSALAYICAYHIALEFGSDMIHSVYTFASPKVGSSEFSDKLTSLLGNSKINNILNTNDAVGYIPFGNNYKRVGDNSKTFTYYEDGWTLLDYHSLSKDYTTQGKKILFNSPV